MRLLRYCYFYMVQRPIMVLRWHRNRLGRMAARCRRAEVRAYAMAAGYFPPEFTRYHVPVDSIGKVRFVVGGFRLIPPGLSKYRRVYVAGIHRCLSVLDL